MIEPGDVFYANPRRPQRGFRLGLSVIDARKVEDGVIRLAAAARRLGV